MPSATGHTAGFFSTPAGRKVLFASLYLSEGAPIGFIWWALPTRLRASGVPIDDITALTAVLVLPWVFKFLWAPLVDTARTSRWNLPEWIISMQILMGLSLIPLALLDFHEYYGLIVALLVLHAVVAATQDASIDALSIAVVPLHERGSLNGWMQTGMLAGRALFGGGALLLEKHLGESAVIVLLVGVVWCSMALVVTARPQLELPHLRQEFVARVQDFLSNFRAALRLKNTWLGLFFAAVGGAGFEAVGAVAGPYLIDQGFSKSEVGVFFGVPVVAGMMSGALLGGYLSDRLGRIRSVAGFLVAMSVIICCIAGIDALFGREGGWVSILALSALYLSIGMFTAASYALFMDLTRTELGATQFSSYMGATNGCESWASFAIGRMVPSLGYAMAFVIMASIPFVTLPVLRLIRLSRTPSRREV